MQRILFFIFFVFPLLLFSQSSFQGLYLEEIDNTSGSFINGEKTYRLYVQLSVGATLNQIFADESRPHSVVTTTSFFNQGLFGLQANLQAEVNDSAFGFLPMLEYDTWVTIGDSYNDDTAPTTYGDVGFGTNLSGSSWTFGGSPNSDAVIFRVPTDSLIFPDANGRVLLGQFTTNGILSGVINLQGFDPDGFSSWEATQVAFSSVIILGCIDSTAFNYDASANTDDGSCIPILLGCIDSTAFNYDASANTDEGSCIPFIYGCID